METNENVQPQQPQESQPPADIPVVDSKQNDERMWAMFCHLAALLGYVGLPPIGIIIGPLIVWLIKKDIYPLVNENGKEALNFQITVGIVFLFCVPLIFVFGLGVLLIGVLWIINLIHIIIASVKTSNGQQFRYPISIRFLK